MSLRPKLQQREYGVAPPTSDDAKLRSCRRSPHQKRLLSPTPTIGLGFLGDVVHTTNAHPGRAKPPLLLVCVVAEGRGGPNLCAREASIDLFRYGQGRKTVTGLVEERRSPARRSSQPLAYLRSQPSDLDLCALYTIDCPPRLHKIPSYFLFRGLPRTP